MQLFSILSTLLLASTALGVRVTYDNVFDNPAGSMWGVSCSNGRNGLVNRFPTYGDFPTFPGVGGAQAVEGWNSVNCGSCWNLTFEGTSILVTAVDHAANGFNIAQKALDTLTGGNAYDWGWADVQAVELERSKCGL